MLNDDVLPSKFALLDKLLVNGQQKQKQQQKQRQGGGDGGETHKELKGLERPWFLGSRLSICDLSCYVLVSELLDGSGPAGLQASVLDACPALLAHARAVAALPAVAAHNAEQGYAPVWL